MPKGTGRPYNASTKMIVKGMKMAKKKGTGQRAGMVPGSEGTPGGPGTFSINKTKRQQARTKRKYK